MKLGIVVPVYNAEKTIIDTLVRLDNISEIVEIEKNGAIHIHLEGETVEITSADVVAGRTIQVVARGDGVTAASFAASAGVVEHR